MSFINVGEVCVCVWRGGQVIRADRITAVMRIKELHCFVPALVSFVEQKENANRSLV